MTPTRRRLAIAVVPRLLGDLLSRALARDDRDVVVVDAQRPADREDHQRQRHFDIALVSDHEPDLAASVVIRLADAPPPGVAHVGGTSVPIRGLEGLVALVDRCAAALDNPSGAAGPH